MSSSAMATHWNDRYRSGSTQWHIDHPSRELMRVVAEDAIPPGAAIDLGCGPGVQSIWLARQGFDVTGIDVSQLAIERAREEMTAAGVSVRFIAADVLESADLGGPYDFFFDRGCYHYIRGIDVDRYMQCLERITHSGSLGLVLAGNANERKRRVLMVSGPIKISATGPPLVNEDQIRGELGALFDIVRLREFRFDPGDWLGWSCLLRRR